MVITDDILIKVISGNSTPDEATLVTEWKALLPENANRYNELKLIWENSVINKSDFNPDIDRAWQNVSQTINKPKSFSIIKIAAAVLLVIGIAIIGKYLFTSNHTDDTNISLNDQSFETKDKNTVKDTRKLIQIKSENEPIEEFLQDSTLVILNENTEVSYREFIDNKRRLVFLNGEAYFDVIHKKESFVVSTDYIDVKVVGTAFGVKAIKGDSICEIFVEEGTVEAYEIKNPKNKIIIHAKERCQYHVKTHEFEKLDSKKKHKWWKNFFSKLKKIIDRLKHRKESNKTDE